MTTPPLDRCTAAVPWHDTPCISGWVECSATENLTVHDYACPHGHMVRRATCPLHAPRPGQIGCRQCWETTRTEVPVTFAPAI